MTDPDTTPEDLVRAAGAPFGAGRMLAGFAIIALFAGIFGAWSSLAPIESAVIAPGIVSVGSSVRTVQHLEGGIVDDILVGEGQAVDSGEILIRLQNTIPFSTLNKVQSEYFEALAIEARLVSERDGLDQIAFPDTLVQKVADRAAQAAMAGQESIFQSRKTLLSDQKTILERKQRALSNEISGLQGQIDAAEEQYAIVTEELADAQGLFDRQLTAKSRVLALQREHAELRGTISQHQAEIGAAEQARAEAELRIAELTSSHTAEIVKALREARAKAYEVGQRLLVAQDVVMRTAIRSPTEGIVVDLDVHTEGGVISAGQPLMKIVPAGDDLVVQATVDPIDIDRVKPGMPATVWLSATNRRSQTGIGATVRNVSADRLIDQRSGNPYYLARIELDAGDVEQGSVVLQAGMGAEVMIRTGARSTFDYLTAPIARSLSRAFREG